MSDIIGGLSMCTCNNFLNNLKPDMALKLSINHTVFKCLMLTH